MRNQDRIDKTDARMLLALTEQPRATAVALAGLTGLSRNTVQARLARLEQHGVLDSLERQIPPAMLGYPLRAHITTQVTQRRLDEVADALACKSTESAARPTSWCMWSQPTQTTCTASPGKSWRFPASSAPTPH
jgi:DNA-binding Lrp family transcriptional regulator